MQGFLTHGKKKLSKAMVYLLVFSMFLSIIPPLQVQAAESGIVPVFSDNFSDGNAMGWTTYKGSDSSKPFDWAVNSQNQFAVAGNTGAKAIADGTSFTDLVYEADVQVNGINSDNSGLLFRVTNPSGPAGDGYNGYYVGMGSDKKLELGRVTSSGWKSLSTADLVKTSGHMKVVAIANNIQVFVDDMSTPKIDYTDNDGDQITSAGAIGVRTYWGTSSIDNIYVREYSATQTAEPAGLADGIYSTSQTVALGAAEGTTIHYTTDGSMPNSSSPVFDSGSPILISLSTVIKAYAEKAGEMASDIVSATYIIGTGTTEFSDDFEDSNADGWTTYSGQNITGTWSVAGGKYELTNSKGDKAIVDNTTYDNFIIDADVNPGSSNDSTGIVLRGSDPGDGCDNISGYFVGININGYVQVGKNDSSANSGNGNWTEIVRAAADVRANQDNHIRVYANGSSFYVFVNGKPAVNFTDSTYTSGSIGVRGWWDTGSVSFDNIQVTSMAALVETVKTPAISPAAISFTDTQTVTISCDTAGAEIHYTTDGSAPTSSSAVYSGAITLSDTATVKAIACKAGMSDSQVQSVTYTKVAAGFTDNFAGDISKWTTYGGTWSISSNWLTVNSGQGYKAIANSTDFSDVSFEADIKSGSTGDAGVLFRVTGAATGGDNVIGYYAGINVGSDAVILGKMNNSWAELTRKSKALDANTSYHLKVVAFGSSIKIYVDDMTTPVITYTDATYTHGSIGLRIYNSNTYFANISAQTYAAPPAIDSFTAAQVVTRANVAPQLPAQVNAIYNNGTTGLVNVTWSAITADMYANPGSFNVEGVVDGTAIKAIAKITVSAAPLVPGEAPVVGNQGTLVKTPFIPLPLGSIKAEGWLLEQLELQKTGATGLAEQLYNELGSDSAWLGGNAASSDWERPVYYVKGLVALAYTLGDTELEDKAVKWIEWALQSQKADGSFGPASSNDWWPRMPMLYAMRDYYEATGDARILTFMTKYFNYQAANLAARPLSDWSKARVGDNIDTVLWLYNRTLEDNLLTLADTLKNQGYDHTDIFTNDKFFDFGTDFHPNHNVNVSEDIKMPTIYYQRSGSDADKNAFRIGDNNLLKYHGQITGMPSGSEFLAGLSSTQPVELCAIVERMQSNEAAQMILGDPYLGDQLEKIAFNALPGAMSKDIKQHQYYSLPNQVQSTISGRGHRQDYTTGLVPSPDSGFPCCRFNMHMGWPYYVKNMWAATDDGGIAAMAYGPSNVTTKINNQLVTVTETTNYPFEEQLQFTVNTTASNTFPLKLRIPEWCDSPVVEVNGQVQTGVTAGEYFTIDRTWTDGDVVTLSVPMKVKTSTQVSNSVGVERGPLVYSLKIGENWVLKTERFPGFGEYEVFPTTAWNYGLVVDKNDPEATISVNKGAMPENPFIQQTTPITLTAKAKKIPSWGLGPNGKDADEVPLGPVISAQAEETVTLVPFGAENLRLTYFPQIATTGSLGSKKYEAENGIINHAEITNGGTNYSTTVSAGKYVGKIDYSDSSVQFNNVYASKAGTYTLEIAYASGSEGYATHLLSVNGGTAQTVKYPPIDGFGKFTRAYATVTLNQGNNAISLAKGNNFAELDYISVLNAEDTLSIPVSSLAVNGQGDVNTITAEKGTLQMVADALPLNASDKSVTWSVHNETGRAKIDRTTGVLTAIANGTVTVTATANDGYGISGTITVTISGQPKIQIPDLLINFNDNSASDWTTYDGIWTAANGIYAVNAGGGYKAVAAATDYSDFTYETDVSIKGGANLDNAGVIFRVSNPTVGADNLKGYYAGICVNGTVQIGRFNNGWKELASQTLGKPITPDMDYHLKVEVTGSSIKVYVDDAMVASATDTMWTHGSIGMRTWNVNAKYDNIAVTIPKNSDATLSDLKVDGTTVTGFAAATTSYAITLPVGTTTPPTVTATVKDAGKAVAVVTQASSVTEAAVVLVTAEDGVTTKTYRVNFAVTPKSTDATLSDLKVGGATIGGFAPATTTYTYVLQIGTTTPPAVTATVKDTGKAVAAVSQAATVTGSAIVLVTAEDGVTTKTYRVNFTLQTSGNTEGNSGGNGSTTTVTTPAAVTSTVEVKPVLSGTTANAAVSGADIQKALAAAKEDSDGSKTVILKVAEVKGADRYTIEVPKASVTSGGNSNLKLESPVGTVVVPGDMFDSKEITGDRVQLTIGLADVSAIKDQAVKQTVGNRPVIELNAAVDGKTVAWNNPEAPVKVSVDYKPTAEELKKAEHITVWSIDESGKAEAVPSARYNAETGEVTFTTNLLSNYAVVYVEKTFSDTGKYKWAENAIEVMASKGVINGTSNTTYSPANNITRGDFMVLLVKALGLNAKTEGNFDDVAEGSYYYNAVAIAKELGITTGVGDNKFDPKANISRQDMLVLAEKAMRIADKTLLSGSAADIESYSDAAQIAGYAQNSIASMVKEGIITGSENMLNPKQKATRAETAVIIYNLYNK